MSVILQKNELRKKMLEKRAKLPFLKKQNYDRWFCEELIKLVKSHDIKTVHAYLPMNNEIDITPLLSYLLSNKITVITPKTLPQRELENRVLTSLENIENGIFGTTHPNTKEEYLGSFDLIIIPGLAYDENNYRLGYGGGYYDGFLKSHPNALKIGVFYPFQKVGKVPVENHDLKLDKILTIPDCS